MRSMGSLMARFRHDFRHVTGKEPGPGELKEAEEAFTKLRAGTLTPRAVVRMFDKAKGALDG